MKKNIIAFFVAVFTSFLLGFQVSTLYYSINDDNNSKIHTLNKDNDFVLSGSNTANNNIINIDKLRDVFNVVNLKFFDKEKIKEAFSGDLITYEAIRGMVESFNDPYTVYLKPSKSVELKESISGVLYGIGAQLEQRGKDIVVVTPIKKMPAEKAGIKAKDIIVKVDDKSLEGMSVNDAVKLIRGPKGTQVKITVYRQGVGLLSFDIIRDEIKIPSVVAKEQSGILILEIIQFDNDTQQELQEIVKEYDIKNIKGIVLDLRNNPGGFMDGAVELASHWIPQNKLVVYRKDYTGQRFDMFSNGYLTFAGKKTAVLLNEASASASEILAAALRDYDLAKIFGHNSFGKGSVQELIDFNDGSSLKITTAKWYTPKDLNIDHEGIKPDYLVDYNIEMAKKGIDTQLQAAIDYILYDKIPINSNTGSDLSNEN